MAVFTTEDAVRLKFQMNDAAWTPTPLVLASIAEAHEAILRRLDPEVSLGAPAEGLVLGETLLAGSCLLRSMASKDAALQKEVTVGGQRVETAKRFASLMALSVKTEELAWAALGPYLRDIPGSCPGSVTGTGTVLGEGA